MAQRGLPMTTALLVLDMLTDFTSGKLANPADLV
jgi:hypothetical protein